MKRLLVALLIAIASAFLLLPAAARADEGWVIRSFDVDYQIAADGTVAATENISADFGGLEKHGIFRDIPIRYEYNSDYDRLIDIDNVSVTSGAGAAVAYELIASDANLRIKIGDPDKLVSGRQSYAISYTIRDSLNPFSDHDEFYWNVTGNAWPVSIDEASASGRLPAAGIWRLTCFQGPTGSTEPCKSSNEDPIARFGATRTLREDSGLTLVLGINKGVVQVSGPHLVPATESTGDTIAGYFSITPLTVGLALAVAVLTLAAIIRQWWVAGRDRWYGDAFYLNDAKQEATRPLMAHESIVVEYQPPEVADHGRRLRPAEVGVLLDERADTLDVSATIIDLAVRKYLLIKETEGGGVFGLFKKKDYELTVLSRQATDLLPYESLLLGALFDDGDTVKLSDLKNKFYKDLKRVKEELYRESVRDKMFPEDPESVRSRYQGAGLGVLVGGGLLAVALGWLFGGAIIAIPLAAGGLLLAFLAKLMPQRSASGRVLYRRALGFRLFMVTAETERQRFAEQKNIFDDYLPYAIVYGCVEKWAKAFEGLGVEVKPGDWYVGTGPFLPAAFAASVGDFSESISNVMASTPGGHGGSGFSGGGSGGGGGGGGGGSW